MKLLPSNRSAITSDVIERWYAAHHDELVRLAAFALSGAGGADELIQELFADLLRTPPDLRDPEAPMAYLRAAVLNRARSRHRRRSTGERVLHTVGQSTPTTVDDVEHRAVQRATRADVLAALDDLPSRQREVVLLRYWLDLSEREIADTLGISSGTVKSSASRAMKALAPALEALR